MPILQAEKMVTSAAKIGLEATIFIFWLKTRFSHVKITQLPFVFKNVAVIRHRY